MQIKKMSNKRKRSDDWLLYNLCFKGLGFPIVSTILIIIVVMVSNPKPLNFDLEHIDRTKLRLVLSHEYFLTILWFLSEWSKQNQSSQIEKQGHKTNGRNEKLIAMWHRTKILWTFYNSKKDIGINFLNYPEPK
jgi:hypothetical protein